MEHSRGLLQGVDTVHDGLHLALRDHVSNGLQLRATRVYLHGTTRLS